MKLIYKKLLFVLLGVIVFLGVLFLGALVIHNSNDTVFWTKVFPEIVIASSCIAGGLVVIYGLSLSEPPPYDLKLLIHAVINQFESDFNDDAFDAMDEMLECLIKGDRCNTDVLYQYLSDSAQENLKEGLTVKRWEED